MDESSDVLAVRCPEIPISDEAAPMHESHQAQWTMSDNVRRTRCLRVNTQMLVMGGEKLKASKKSEACTKAPATE